VRRTAAEEAVLRENHLRYRYDAAMTTRSIGVLLLKIWGLKWLLSGCTGLVMTAISARTS
jgi:hypothetical protein